MSSYNAYFGQLEIDADNKGVDVDGGTADLTEGDYYIYSPTTAESLLDHLCTTATAEHGATISYSITADGILTLSAAGTFSIEFDSTLYLAFGYTTSLLSGSNSYTATNKLMYCWFPEMLQASSLAPVSSEGQIVPVISQQQAADKSVWTTKYGELVNQELGYQYLEKDKVWKKATPDNESFEEFFSTTYSQGRKVLFIPGYSDDVTVLWYYVANLKEGEVLPTESITGSDTYYNISLNLRGVDA